MLIEVEKIFVDIFRNQMGLASDQVLIGSENFKIPNDNRVYVFVRMVDATVYKSIVFMDQNDREQQEVSMREMIQVDIASSGRAARQRRVEIVMSLRSFYSQQQQENNNFRIFRIPSTFVNATEIEGPRQINRFTLVIPTFTWYNRTRDLPTFDFYDQFSLEITEEA